MSSVSYSTRFSKSKPNHFQKIPKTFTVGSSSATSYSLPDLGDVMLSSLS